MVRIGKVTVVGNALVCGAVVPKRFDPRVSTDDRELHGEQITYLNMV